MKKHEKKKLDKKKNQKLVVQTGMFITLILSILALILIFIINGLTFFLKNQSIKDNMYVNLMDVEDSIEKYTPDYIRQYIFENPEALICDHTEHREEDNRSQNDRDDAACSRVYRQEILGDKEHCRYCQRRKQDHQKIRHEWHDDGLFLILESDLLVYGRCCKGNQHGDHRIHDERHRNRFERERVSHHQETVRRKIRQKACITAGVSIKEGVHISQEKAVHDRSH